MALNLQSIGEGKAINAKRCELRINSGGDNHTFNVFLRRTHTVAKSLASSTQELRIEINGESKTLPGALMDVLVEVIRAFSESPILRDEDSAKLRRVLRKSLVESVRLYERYLNLTSDPRLICYLTQVQRNFMYSLFMLFERYMGSAEKACQSFVVEENLGGFITPIYYDNKCKKRQPLFYRSKSRTLDMKSIANIWRVDVKEIQRIEAAALRKLEKHIRNLNAEDR